MNTKKLQMTKNLLTTIALGFFMIIAIGSGDENTEDKTGTTENATENAKVENWKYSEDADKMEGTKQFYATNTSTNEIEFEFPYDGGSTFDILVRNLGKENEVVLTVSKGQFMTSIGGNEQLKVKFDDEKSVNFSYNSADDASMDVIFLNNSAKFLKKLKTAKKVMIECTFFNAGSKVIEFNVEGLKWDK